MEQAIRYLRDHRAEHLDWLTELCRIPSISTKKEHQADVARAVQWIHELCTRVGLKSQVHETGGHPLVLAEWCAAADMPTVLVYGHVDVQPEGDLALWDAGPFEPVQRDDWLICRGSADDKGQILVYLRAAAAWLQTTGRLPLNVKFLIEAEEEISSPNLAPFVQKQQQRLACDHVLISDTGLYEDGWPTITYGTRGILYKEVRVSGPKHDLHSGSFGGSVANPANVLAQFIASLHDADHRVALPGFYDDVLELTAAEKTLAERLPFDEQQYLDELGCPAPWGERGYSSNERRSSRPTLDVNGIYGGFMQEGANTIIPARAGAKISMRLVPNQDPDRISRTFDEAVKQRIPAAVRHEILNHGKSGAYVTPVDGAAMRAADRALAEAFGRPVVYIREGGSLPILPMFKRVLGADSLLLGLASPQCNAHGPNEKVNLRDLDRGAEAVVRLWEYLRK